MWKHSDTNVKALRYKCESTQIQMWKLSNTHMNQCISPKNLRYNVNHCSSGKHSNTTVNHWNSPKNSDTNVNQCSSGNHLEHKELTQKPRYKCELLMFRKALRTIRVNLNPRYKCKPLKFTKNLEPNVNQRSSQKT